MQRGEEIGLGAARKPSVTDNEAYIIEYNKVEMVSKSNVMPFIDIDVLLEVFASNYSSTSLQCSPIHYGLHKETL